MLASLHDHTGVQDTIKEIYLNIFGGFFHDNDHITLDDMASRILIMSPSEAKDTYSVKLANAFLGI